MKIYGTCTASLIIDHSDSLYILLWVVFPFAEWFGADFREFASIFIPRNEIPSCFSSAQEFWREVWELASILVPRYGIPSCFLFHWGFGREFREFASIFVSTERNSELFSLPRKGSERNSESFLFCGTAGIPSENNNLFRLFRVPRNYFLSEIPNRRLAMADCVYDLLHVAMAACRYGLL